MPVKKVLTIAFCILLIASGCNLPLAASPAGEESLTPQIGLELTALLNTQLTEETMTTLMGMPTNSPEFTIAPSLTPQPTLTFTPMVAMVSVSKETNCRTGPGSNYDLLGALKVGESAQVVGRNASGDTWVIKLPSNPAITCWLWGYYATVTGNTSELMVFTPPPTPTPVPDFTFSYYFWGVGPGFGCYMFDVSNTGGMKWESYSLTAQDITQGISGSNAANNFITYDSWCMATVTQSDLTPGETGTASVVLVIPASTAGDHFQATLKLCSQDNQAGTCITKTINFIF